MKIHPQKLAVAALLTGLMQTVPHIVHAAELVVTVQTPRHKERPYVAVWLAREGHNDIVRNLTVWHEGARPDRKEKKKKKNKGDKYLKDLRVWWRAGGQNEAMPMDGVSGPTRAAGTHTLTFRSGEHPLNTLEKGRYQLMVEAAREDGGEELLRLPLDWPPGKTASTSVQGSLELTEVRLDTKP